MNNEDQQEHPTTNDDLAAYYESFDQRTNRGLVFTDDLSRENVPVKSLTPDEKHAREAYQTSIAILYHTYDAYDDNKHPIARTKEEVLQQRVVAPCLAPKNVSSRSRANEPRAGRMYPQSIHPWNEFQALVKDYKISEDSSFMPQAMKRIFYKSLSNAKSKCCDEAEEQKSLMDNLDQTLKEAGIIHSVDKITSFPGKMDFCVMKDNATVSIICECKSTHNLLLPMKADDCKALYDKAYIDGKEANLRPHEWSNVAHPIGQLLGYMVERKHRYGALSSGTRTYFIKIQMSTRGCGFADPDGEEQKSDDAHHMTTRSQAKKPKIDVAANPREIQNAKQTVGFKRLYRSTRNWIGALKAGTRTKTKRKALSQNQNSHSNDNSHENASAGNDSYCEMDSGVEVYISDAWFTGQEDYLRAWAYMHTLHETTMEPWTEPTDWITSTSTTETMDQWGKKPASSKSPGRNEQGKSTTPIDVRDSDHAYHSNSAKTCNLDHYFSIHKGLLDYAPFDDIVIIDVLGGGRNGACFKVQWNGIECAMKCFDIGRDGDTYFKKEIQAYILLQKAWGVLVPQPLFLSESFSGGRLFLGLQLGRESTTGDDLPKFQNVLRQLQKKFGIRHNDAECGRNMIVITDTSGVERVVAIDLEDWVEV